MVLVQLVLRVDVHPLVPPDGEADLAAAVEARRGEEAHAPPVHGEHAVAGGDHSALQHVGQIEERALPSLGRRRGLRAPWFLALSRTLRHNSLFLHVLVLLLIGLLLLLLLSVIVAVHVVVVIIIVVWRIARHGIVVVVPTLSRLRILHFVLLVAMISAVPFPVCVEDPHLPTALEAIGRCTPPM